MMAERVIFVTIRSELKLEFVALIIQYIYENFHSVERFDKLQTEIASSSSYVKMIFKFD